MLVLTFLVEALVTAVCMSWGDSSPLCRTYHHQLQLSSLTAHHDRAEVNIQALGYTLLVGAGAQSSPLRLTGHK